MNLHYTFKHLKSSETIKKHALSKSEKFQKYFQGKFSVNWVFSHDSHSQVATVEIHGNHLSLRAEGNSESLYGSIDEAVDRLVHQLKKKKGKVTDHHHAEKAAHKRTG